MTGYWLTEYDVNKALADRAPRVDRHFALDPQLTVKPSEAWQHAPHWHQRPRRPLGRLGLALRSVRGRFWLALGATCLIAWSL
jgi:hypothetical protein